MMGKMIIHKVSDSNIGEPCFVCKDPSSHKIEECLIYDQDYSEVFEVEIPNRHPFTTRLCCEHFWMIMGIFAQKYCEELSVQNPLTNIPKVL